MLYGYGANEKDKKCIFVLIFLPGQQIWESSIFCFQLHALANHIIHLWQEKNNQVFLKETTKFYESAFTTQLRQIRNISHYTVDIHQLLFFPHPLLQAWTLANRKQALLLDVCTNMQVLKMRILIIRMYDWFQLFVRIGHLWLRIILRSRSEKWSKCKQLPQGLMVMCSLELVTSENTYILPWPEFYLEMFTSKELFLKIVTYFLLLLLHQLNFHRRLRRVPAGTCYAKMCESVFLSYL